jgi:dTDP-4-dehydrorhamnose reductase
MRIVLTGTTGQVGNALRDRLRSSATLISADRRNLDLAQPDRLASRLEDMAPDLIINCAAYTAVDRAEDEPALAETVNAKAPGIMAQWAAKNGVRFIHFSTDYVFDGSGERPWREDDATLPLSVYGSTKLAGERKVRAAGGSFLILRTSWIYAAKGTNFLCKIAELARSQKELRVVADQIGAPTSAALIGDAVAKIVGMGLDDLRSKAAQAQGIVHLCASGETSWHLFATAIVNGLKARGVHLAIERVLAIRSEERPARARRPLNSRLDLALLSRVFGITPPDWRMALEPELDALADDFNCRAANIALT